MKTPKLTLIAIALLFAGFAKGQTTTYNFNSAPNALIPDGNPVGLTGSTNVSGVSGAVNNIQVTLNITGGFNGDLYAYLVAPGGQMAVLLNRVGVTAGNAFGNGDPGFNITLDSSGAFANIHGYTSTGSQLTGTFAPDGRNISPGSSPGAFDIASTAADLSQFTGLDPNGVWTFFIADVSGGGGQSTLVSWGLTIVTVPEPQTWAMLAGGAGTLLILRRRSRR